MNFYKLRNKNIICFPKKELVKLFEIAKKTELLQEMRNRDISFDDLRNDFPKMTRLANVISQKTSKDRDDHEVFASIFIFSDFYGKDSEICFELQDSFNLNKDKIITLQDLNKFRTGTFSDFIIKLGNEFRQFQLKRYQEGLNTQNIFDFIKKKIEHYANDLGDMNLLLVLQSQAWDVSYVDFHELHDKLKSLNLTFRGQILISYNESDREKVINQVYPDITTTRIPVRYPSAQLDD